MYIGGPNQKTIQNQVLPHEVMHTVMAVYMNAPAPRWADEGYATLMERPQPVFQRERVIPFKELMNLQDYPPDHLNFYGESVNVVSWLVDLKGKIVFRDFLYDYLHTPNTDWPVFLKKYYGFDSYEEAQAAWQQKKVLIDVSN